MTDTLKRIAGPANIANGDSTLFTGTAAHVYTIRHMTISNNTGGAITLRLGVGGLTDDKLFLPTSSIDAGGFAEFSGILVLTGAEALEAHASATGLAFTMSGLDQS